MSNPLLEAALMYAGMGIPVLPLHYIENGKCSCRKENCDKAGKHPFGALVNKGLLNATKDPDTIRKWWSLYPNCNIGLPTGKASGFWVLDLDVKDDYTGMMSLRSLTPKGAVIPETVTVQTGGGGEQIYFRYPDGDVFDLVPSRANFFGDDYPYIDTRINGAYVVAPPSRHISGRQYEFVDSDPSEGTPIAPAPTWLIDRILAVKATQKVRRVNALEYEVPGRQAGLEKFNQGSRNVRLTQALGYIHNLLPLDITGLNGIAQAINKSICIPPLDPDEVTIIAESVLSMDRNFTLRGAALMEGHDDVINLADADDVNMESGEVINYRMTDEGHARRAIAHAKGTIVYSAPIGGWGTYDGRRWQFPDTKDAIAFQLISDVKLRFERRVAKCREALKAIDADDAETRTKIDGKIKLYAQQVAHLESSRTISSVATLMQKLVIKEAREFDASHDVLNVLNGTVDLTSRTIRAHSPNDLITKICNIKFDPAAKCPQFERFISWMFMDDPEMVRYIQKLLGYCLTGSTQEQKFYFLHGEGRNGKSTLINILRHIAEPYCGTVPSSELMYKENLSPIRHHIAALRGSRIAISSEIRAGARLDEPKIKDLTGGDWITADLKGQNSFIFKPTFKLILVGNYVPSIPGTDVGIWRRLVCIPCEASITDSEVDPHLEDKLKSEASGILNWMMDGIELWRKEGLKAPDRIERRVAQYKAEEDRIGQWIKECCISRPGDMSLQSPGNKIFQDFHEYCRRYKYSTLINMTQFTREMVKRGFSTYTSAGGGGFIGIYLRDGSSPAPEPPYDPFTEK